MERQEHYAEETTSAVCDQNDSTPQGDQDEFDRWVEENFDEGDQFFLIPEYQSQLR